MINRIYFDKESEIYIIEGKDKFMENSDFERLNGKREIGHWDENFDLRLVYDWSNKENHHIS